MTGDPPPPLLPISPLAATAGFRLSYPMPSWTDAVDRRITLKDDVRRRDDVLGAVSHGLGFLAALTAAVLLVIQARSASSPGRAAAAAAIYGLSMCLVFGVSTAYHALRPSTAKRILRLLDHSSIYILIAGTYTPYAMAMDEAASRNLLLAVWSLGVLGLVLNIVLWDRFKVLHIAVYLIMGWLVVFFWRPLLDSAPAEQIRWMLAGGLAYTLGVVFYAARRLPLHHVVWHLFVIAGAAGLHMGISLYALERI